MSDRTERAAERFLELLRPIERDLEVYARRQTSDAQDAADAIQNAVLRAFRAFDRYHEDAHFRTWMFKILTNEVFALNRKRGRIARFEVAMSGEELDRLAEAGGAADAPDVGMSWEVLAGSLDEDIVAAMNALPEAERAVLLLRAVGDLRYREIAEALDIPLGSVMGYLFRARRKMREAIVRTQRRAAP